VSFTGSTIVSLSTGSGGEFVGAGSLAPRQDVDISGSCLSTTLHAKTTIIGE
jgi:hypothetical protein